MSDSATYACKAENKAGVAVTTSDLAVNGEYIFCLSTVYFCYYSKDENVLFEKPVLPTSIFYIESLPTADIYFGICFR